MPGAGSMRGIDGAIAMTNVLVGLSFLALAIFSFLSASQFRSTLIQDHGLGASFFPQIVSVGIGIISLVVLVREIIAIRGSSSRNGPAEGGAITVAGARDTRAAILVLALLVLFTVLAPLIGFLAGTVLFFTAALAVLGERSVIRYLIGTAFACGVYALFRFGFLVRLPVGTIW